MEGSPPAGCAQEPGAGAAGAGSRQPGGEGAGPAGQLVLRPQEQQRERGEAGPSGRPPRPARSQTSVAFLAWSLRAELRIKLGLRCAHPCHPRRPDRAPGPGPRGGVQPRYLKVDCSSLKAAFRCFISSACFFLSSCSALISSSKRLDTFMAWTWDGVRWESGSQDQRRSLWGLF